MKHSIMILVLAVVTTVANAQTNTVDLNAEQLRRRIEAQIQRGQSLPIPLTPEEDALLVKEGVLPPMNQQHAAAGTNSAAMVSLRMRDVPLEVAADTYSEFVGKKVTVQDGLSVPITVHTTGSITRAQAAVLMEQSFAGQSLRVVVVDSGAIRIEKMK